MRRQQSERAAWTEYVTGEKQKNPPKYGNEAKNGFASKHEADVAMKLMARERAGQIQDLKFQARLVLVEGRDGVRSIIYIADFRYSEDGQVHWLDAKGVRTPVYRIKKKLAFLLHGIEIEEV